ncbi:MAG: pyrroline-5-carboxylate reductase [Gammaproteobacteria bacterium]|nr:pyrroline-5-carboxylate reductase [Gammaproteobacteria bacterium]
MKQTLCFIGAGNMASSLIGGLLANNFDASQITACDICAEQLQNLSADYAINTSTDNIGSVTAADIVLLAVKPQVMQTVCEQLASLEDKTPQLFISIAAGVRETDINRWLGGNRAIVRCMPNTPSLMQLGATALYANSQVQETQKQIAQSILDAVGITVWVDNEARLDAVTAISGSGPAYFFYFIELLQQAGIELGLDAKTSLILARQTALGAANMAMYDDVVDLRNRVTSKKGTTEQAILSLQKNRLDALLEAATRAAFERAVELGDELANQN